MKKLLALSFLIFVSSSLFAQSDSNTPLPKDPKAILEMAKPFYDYTSTDLKPWHMKVEYQLYDEKGQPGNTGVYEYWWVSKDLNRSSWTMNGSTHTVWSAAQGKKCYSKDDKNVSFLEYGIKTALLSPLPDLSDLDNASNQLELEYLKNGDSKLPCIKMLPNMTKFGSHTNIPLGLFPSYCFDPNNPILLLSFSYGSLMTTMNHVVKIQDHFVPKNFEIFEGKRKLLTANLIAADSIRPDNPALIPPSDVITSSQECVAIPGSVMAGKNTKKQAPIYPQDAKDNRISGTVVLKATIGIDGNIHELKVVSTPWPTLASSALQAVSRWHYQPTLMNGEPVEVKTEIKVVYSLGG